MSIKWDEKLACWPFPLPNRLPRLTYTPRSGGDEVNNTPLFIEFIRKNVLRKKSSVIIHDTHTSSIFEGTSKGTGLPLPGCAVNVTGNCDAVACPSFCR
jgi:hypothetical protein